MRNIDFSNRRIFGNIFVKKDDSFILLNLLSFRRMRISKQDLETLFVCKEKMDCRLELSEEEKMLFDSLTAKKQIISDELRSRYIEGKAKEHEENLGQITHKISHITITPTFSCNFNCEYCYQRKFQSKKDVLSPDDIDSICHALKTINKTEKYLDGITEVTINGGEPLQSKNIATIKKIIQCFAKPDIKLTLLTNGYNIMRLKDEIDFSKFESIQVSLDNVDPNPSEINGVKYSVFQNVLDGLAYLTQFDCYITVAAMFNRELFENIDEFIRRLDSIGIVDNEKCRIQISPIMAFGKGSLDESFFTLAEFAKIRKEIRMSRVPKNLIIPTITEARHIGQALYRETNERLEGKPTVCSMMTNRSVHFAPDGKIYWCLCVEPNAGMLGQFYPSIDVDEAGIDKCIHRSIYSHEKCKACEYQFLCSSGCPLHCVAATGDYTEPFCGFFFNPSFWENLEDLL